MFELRPFNFSDADYAAIATINLTVFPDRHRRSEDFKRVDHFTPQVEYDWARTVAECDGKVIGYGLYTRALWLDTPNLYSVGWVTHPDYRNRGIATAYRQYLLDEVLPKREVNAVIANGRSDMPAGVRFLEQSGFAVSIKRTRSVLNLTTFDPQQYASRTVAIRERGIILKPLSELLESDPQHVEKLIMLYKQLQEDEPHVERSARISAEKFHYQFMSSEHYHPEGWFIALDDEEYIGWCAVLPDLTHSNQMQNGITVIDRRCRRIGLATAMKVHALHYAQKLGKKSVITGNVSTNPMLKLNLKLGFVPQFDEIEFKKTLLPE